MNEVNSNEASSTGIKFNQAFSFKTVTPEKLEKLSQSLDTTLPKEQFEEIKDDAGEVTGYKRKQVSVELTAPSFIAGLPESAQNVIKDFVSQFVKAQYVDYFLPVGAHDWETIEAELAKSRRGGVKLEISDEAWADAAKSYQDYFAQILGNEQAAERMGSIMAGKFSATAIRKNANEFSEGICAKLEERTAQWAQWVSENAEEETIDDLANVYTFVSNRLSKHLDKLREANVSLGDIL